MERLLRMFEVMGVNKPYAFYSRCWGKTLIKYKRIKYNGNELTGTLTITTPDINFCFNIQFAGDARNDQSIFERFLEENEGKYICFSNTSFKGKEVKIPDRIEAEIMTA